VSGVAFVEEASIVTTEFPIGLVVPKVEGVDVLETALASSAKAEAAIRCRGAKFSKVTLSSETSTFKKTSRFVLKLKSSA